MKVSIGNVAVTDDQTVNPYKYRGPLYSGDARVAALRSFKHGEPTDGMVLWEAPASGGARRITAADVAWETSGIK